MKTKVRKNSYRNQLLGSRFQNGFATCLIGIGVALMSSSLTYALPKSHGPKGTTSGTATDERCNSAWLQCMSACEGLQPGPLRNGCEHRCGRSYNVCQGLPPEAPSRGSVKHPSKGSAAPITNEGKPTPKTTPTPRPKVSPVNKGATNHPAPREKNRKSGKNG